MEVTVHLPVSTISDVISRALGGHTRLELCKIYQYADLNNAFYRPIQMITFSVRGLRQVQASRWWRSPWLDHREHISAGAFVPLYVASMDILGATL
jgi:hypothetical protein